MHLHSSLSFYPGISLDPADPNDAYTEGYPCLSRGQLLCRNTSQNAASCFEGRPFYQRTPPPVQLSEWRPSSLRQCTWAVSLGMRFDPASSITSWSSPTRRRPICPISPISRRLSPYPAWWNSWIAKPNSLCPQGLLLRSFRHVTLDECLYVFACTLSFGAAAGHQLA